MSTAEVSDGTGEVTVAPVFPSRSEEPIDPLRINWRPGLSGTVNNSVLRVERPGRKPLSTAEINQVITEATERIARLFSEGKPVTHSIINQTAVDLVYEAEARKN